MILKLILLLFLNLSVGLELGLFLYLIGQKVSVKQFILLLLLQPVFNFVCNLTNWTILPYVSEEIFYISLSFLLLRKSSLSSELKLFQGLLFLSVTNLSFRMITFFIYPLLNISNEFLKKDIVFANLSVVIPTLLSFLLIRLFKQSFKFLQKHQLNIVTQRIIQIANVMIFLYFLIQQYLVYFEDINHSSTLELRKLIVIIYIILFLLMLIFLDRTTRDMMQKELDFQKDIQLKNLSAYNHKIEELYQTVRSFRHDYRNLLTTLKLGIDQDNMTMVRETYTTVLERSDEKLETEPFDLARLINLQDNTLKSLLSAKFLQAEAQQIDVSLEIPDPITLEGMGILDFITIVSILIDNAMEATVNAKRPQMMIAYVRHDRFQRFILKNSTKEESIPIASIFRKDVSSKGADRGIGLANVQEILDHYPDVSLNTSSDNFEFVQDLIIRI